MNPHDLIKELRDLHIRENEIKNQLREFVTNKFHEERTFADGEVVEVWINGKYKEDGIIEGGRTDAHFDALDIKNYAEKPAKFTEAMNEFRYSVKKVKKDGSASKHRVSYNRTLSTQDDGYSGYIKKKSA